MVGVRGQDVQAETVSPGHRAAAVLLVIPVQDQASQRCSTERGKGHKSPPLPEKLLTADDCWERATHFFVGVWPLLSQLCSIGGPGTSKYTGSTEWTQWI